MQKKQLLITGNETKHIKEASSSKLNNKPNGTKSLEDIEIGSVTPIGKTPFAIVNAGGKYFVAVGKMRLTDLMPTYADCMAWINQEKTWETLSNVMTAIIKTFVKPESLNQL